MGAPCFFVLICSYLPPIGVASTAFVEIFKRENRLSGDGFAGTMAFGKKPENPIWRDFSEKRERQRVNEIIKY